MLRYYYTGSIKNHIVEKDIMDARVTMARSTGVGRKGEYGGWRGGRMFNLVPFQLRSCTGTPWHHKRGERSQNPGGQTHVKAHMGIRWHKAPVLSISMGKYSAAIWRSEVDSKISVGIHVSIDRYRNFILRKECDSRDSLSNRIYLFNLV